MQYVVYEVWVDKSALLKEVIQNPHSVYLLMPLSIEQNKVDYVEDFFPKTYKWHILLLFIFD